MIKLLKPREVAEMTGKSLVSIYRNLEDGSIPGGVRIGGSIRVNAEVFERYIREASAPKAVQ